MLGCLLSLAFSSIAHSAVTAPAAATPIRDLDAVVVSGVQPGPGLWRVSKGDHAMWVLGTQSPLPRKMEWVSRDVERAVAQSQEVIWAPWFGVQVQPGVFQTILLIPKLVGARRNPDGATLHDVVPAPMYARWQRLKADYIGRDRGIENWRPIFAAMELWDAAIERSGLTQQGTGVVSRLAKAHGLRQTRVSSILVIKDAKVALNEFRTAKLDDLDCFGNTMLRLETDLAAMKARANAWAVGDIEALRALPYTDQNEACERAAMQAGVVRKRLDRDLDAELERKWFEAAEKALASNAGTFALLPMAELLKPDGYLAKLEARGYTVEAP
jgi:hypothetical protein